MIEEKIGNPKMTWEGPEPHDFREVRAGRVRFVHSELLYKTPDFAFEGVADYAPDGKILFKILVGDDAAAADIGARIAAAGYEWTRGEPSEFYSAISFEVDTRSPLP